MKLLQTLSFLLLCFFLQGQSLDDWTWYDSDFFERDVRNLEVDNAGNIWMTSGNNIIIYDGQDFQSYNALESGIEVGYSVLNAIDVSIDNVVWTVINHQALRYDVDSNLWTVFIPFYEGNVLSPSNIKVASEDEIWVGTQGGLWEYNGVEWTHRKFVVSGINMRINSPRLIEIDGKNQKWVTTSVSICIEGGCYTPGGVIRINETDTTFYDGETLGFPNGETALIDINSKDEVVFATSDFYTKENFYITQINDEWTEPVSIPLQGRLRNMKIGSEDQIYFLFEEFIAIESNGTWSFIPIDPDEIDQYYSLLISAKDDIYISGYKGETSSEYKGVLGFLPNYNFRARGTVYSDLNKNGVFDEGDNEIKNHFVRTTDLNRLTLTDFNGNYSLLFSDSGTYEIESILPKYHAFGNPDDGVQSIDLTDDIPTNIGNDFGFEPDTTAVDLSISISALNPANPGFQTCYSINIKNNAPRLTQGIVTASLDKILTFESSTEVPSTINGNDFTFEVPEMTWLEMRNIRMCFSLPPDPELFGDTLKHNISIDLIYETDLVIENNFDSICHLITGPFDPNYIAVLPEGEGEYGDIPLTTKSLEYIIHFQNIGTDTARNIYINNPIDLNLDLTSLNVIGTSHEYELEFNETTRVLKWSFDNINLPDSTANELESNGFIKYTLDLKTNEVGKTFTNYADIFFDFNLPISTNTAINTIAELPVSIFEYLESDECDFSFNVEDQKIWIYFPNWGEYEVAIFDFNGKKLISSMVNNVEASLDLSRFTSGSFIVFVQAKDCGGTGKVFVK